MDLSFATPAQSLSHLVATYYLVNEDYAVMEDSQRADTGHLRIFLCGSGYYQYSRNKRLQSTRFFLNGPFTQHMRSIVQGPIRFLGIALFPEAWGGLIGTSAAEFANHAADARTMLGASADAYFEQMAALTTIEEMVPILDAFLVGLVKPVPSDQRMVIQKIRSWLAAAMFPDVSDLYASVALSERQVMRLANRFYGAPPKALARTYGALKTASAIVMNDGAIPDEAIAHYADKSHLIREVKRVTGQTPRQLMTSINPIMRITLHPSNFKELEEPA
jgi:AraC-like DNA-binding protein